MFIPAQTPDLLQPLTQLLEAKPVQPVTAVPGIPEDAQNLDSRVALQWAQPVLQGEKGQAARTAVSVPLAVQIVKPLNIKGFEPQGPDPDALLKGEVHPMLAEGLASWLNFVLSKTAPSLKAQAFRELPVQVKAKPNQSAETDRPTIESSSTDVVETSVVNELPSTPDGTVQTQSTEIDELTQQVKPEALKVPSLKDEPKVLPTLANLYKELTESDIFAAQRLTEAWLPRRTKPQDDLEPNTQAPMSEKTHSAAKHAVPVGRDHGFQEEIKSLSQPVSEPSIAQLTKWVAALEPDSENAQQVAHMLTQGQMMWQADLAPGIPMRMVREDAWRNAANKPAQLEKGALLKVEVELPNLGRIRITGSQWGEDLSIQIAHASEAQGHWTNHVSSLLQDLKASGISDVRLETLVNDSEAPNG